MGTVVSVDDLAEDIRVNLDLPEFVSGSGFVPEEAVYRMIQQSAFRLSGILHESFGDTDFMTTTVTSCNTAGMTSTPANMFKLLNVNWNRDANTIVSLDPARKSDLAWTSQISWSTQLPRYVLARSALQFYAPPIETMSITIQHTTGIFTSLTPGPANVFDGQAGWGEWIVLDVCAKIRRKE